MPYIQDGNSLNDQWSQREDRDLGVKPGEDLCQRGAGKDALVASQRGSQCRGVPSGINQDITDEE